MRAVKPYIISKEYKDKQRKRIRTIVLIIAVLLVATISYNKIEHYVTQANSATQTNSTVPINKNTDSQANINVTIQPTKETPVHTHAAISRRKHRHNLQQLLSITIESSPPGALVKIDRENKGTTPVTVGLKSGSHGITIEKQGYKTLWDILNVKKGEKSTFDYTLSTE